MKAESRRVEWIDALRGISAFLVAFAHVTGLILEKVHTHGGLVYISWMVGRIGVIMFFMISGFVIPYSLHNRSVKQFVISRFFRLYPAYWISIIAIIAVSGFVSFKQILANLTMFQKLFGIDDLVGVYWTLQIELCFYIICAALFYFGYLFKDRAIKYMYIILLIMTALLAVGRFESNSKLPVAIPLSLSVMFLGFLYRKYIYHEGDITKKQFIIYLVGFVAIIIPVSFLAYNKDYGFNEKWWQYAFSYIIAVGVFIIYSYYKVSNAFLLFLGNISFSIYLFHQISITLMEKMHLYDRVNQLCFVAIFLTISIIASTVCYYAVEKPFIQVGKRILKKNAVKVI